MAKFRKKPVVIDAFQWSPGVPWPLEFSLAAGNDILIYVDRLEISTLEGTMTAQPGVESSEPVETVCPGPHVHASHCPVHAPGSFAHKP